MWEKIDKQEQNEECGMLAVLEGASVLLGANARVEIVDEGPGQVPTAVEIALPRATLFNAANIRQQMAATFADLGVFTTQVVMPAVHAKHEPDVEMVEL